MQDCLTPHLYAQNADTMRVMFKIDIEKFSTDEWHYGKRPYAFPGDLNQLEHDLKTSPDTRLVVIDTLKTFAPTPKLMRESLAMLDELAAKYQVAILVLIQSPVKYDKEDKLKKDPRPWDEAAPYVWCLSRDPLDPDLCRFEPKRTTFCREPDGLAFRIQDDGTLAFEPLVHRKSTRELCKDWLKERLAGGSIDAKQMLDEGKQHGYSESMLWRAKTELGITSNC